MMLTLVCGCGQSTNSEYSGLDAKETYAKLIEKMNSEVHYTMIRQENADMVYEQDVYMIDGKLSLYGKEEFADSKHYMYTLTLPDKIYNLYPNEGKSKLEEIDTQPIKTYLNNFFESDMITMDSHDREDTKEGIVLTFHYHFNRNDEQGNPIADDIAYIENKMTINDQGYIEKEEAYTCTDETYKTKIDSSKTTYQYSHYNEKSEDDLNKVIEIFKSSDGKTYEEVHKLLG